MRCSLSTAGCFVAAGFILLGAGESGKSVGVIVEEVSKGSVADKAGLRAGDVILAWKRAATPPANPRPVSGRIETPFDLAEVELEQSPRGQVLLTGTRGQEKRTWALSPGEWRLKVRPALQQQLPLFEGGKELVASGSFKEGGKRWRNAGERARHAGQEWLAAWFFRKAGEAFAQAESWEDVDAAYANAVKEAERRAPGMAAQISTDWCTTFRGKRRKPDAEEQCYRRALAYGEKVASRSLGIARILYNVGRVADYRGDVAAGEEYLRRALTMQEVLAPASLEVATSLNLLGLVIHERGDLVAAEDHYRRALMIREALAPGSLAVAASLSNLGVAADDRGDLTTAEDYHRRALAIREGLAPGGLDVARSLNNLGVVTNQRGDISTAEDLFRRALAIQEAQAPGSHGVANALENLGIVAEKRGDLAVAEEFYRRALAIREAASPGGLPVAGSLNALGNLAWTRGDLAAAEDQYQRALTVRETLAPGSWEFAETLNNLGEVAYARGDLRAAGDRHRRALAILETLAPGSLAVATSLTDLGLVARSRGDVVEEEELFRRALMIRQELAPGSISEAESLHHLGLAYRRAAKVGLAAQSLCDAVDALERQKTRLGGTQDARATFGAKYAGFYRDCLDVKLELSQPEQGFHILERSRARSFLEMLAERDLLFAADLPPEIARERRRSDADYDQTQEAIGKLNPAKDAAEIARLLGRLRQIREEQEAIAGRIRKASPRLAALQYPQPLDLIGVQGVLDPGTVLLSYSVAKDKTVLFVVRPDRAPNNGLSTFSVPLEERTLRGKVETLRRLIQLGAAGPALTSQAAELYDVLIKPAESVIASSQRILISPDGPLHTLPFAALVRKGPAGKEGQIGSHLIEWKPIHVVLSATVYGELKKDRPERPPAAMRLAAFGDPIYPSLSKERGDRIRNLELRSVVARGLDLEPLPSSREEVEGIARLYPDTTQKYLGGEATEEQAKALGKAVRYIHFACHGLLDARFPLNSALALTIPESPAAGQDNGLFQAWEIFESMRIDADLVTLSACGTGLGKEIGGEGLVGLTRAFQYAGARSVLASLWSVSDESTADLMKRFYGYLKAGKAKDHALQAAQVDLIRAQGSISHPFHWAAFQMIGDWR